jgi:hypothetical protein
MSGAILVESSTLADLNTHSDPVDGPKVAAGTCSRLIRTIRKFRRGAAKIIICRGGAALLSGDLYCPARDSLPAGVSGGKFLYLFAGENSDDTHLPVDYRKII